MKQLILATGCVALSLMIPLKASAASMYSELYVFGDSLSDSGRYYKATNGKAPPLNAFPNKLYTNDQIWPQYLASRLELSYNPDTNFAIAGAYSGRGNARSSVAGIDLPGVIDQIDNFITANPVTDPNALYTIYGSVNDYFYGGQTNTNVPVANTIEGVTKLVNAGAKNIVVFNSGALQVTPGASLGESVQTPEGLKALVEEHNSQLSKALEDLKQTLDPSVNIIPFDIYSVYLDQVNNPEKYGYTNVDSSCVNNPLAPTDIPEDCRKKPENYLWWDTVHFSSQGYSVVADAVYSRVHATKVPEPYAGLGLFSVATLSTVLLLKKKQKKVNLVQDIVKEVCAS
ncbi:SGNH/GDSL hydrolase family protein [Scytonema sp. NUACC21]